MAYKTRRCDKVLAKPAAPPSKEVCPICKRPPDKIVVTSEKNVETTVKEQGCSFFARCAKIKLDDDPKLSAEKRSQHFRQFHAECCEQCRLPKEECRKKRLMAVRRRLKKDVEEDKRNSSYTEPDELTKLVDEQQCVAFVIKNYTPVVPDWYTTQE